MSRAGWLAVGAVGGATLTQVEPPAAVLALAAVAVALATVASRAGRFGSNARRSTWAALGIGATLVLVRALVGGAVAGPAMPLAAPVDGPSSSAHEAVVVSVGTPSGGLQRATVELRTSPESDRVYAWLPRYPQVVAGDLVKFGGQLEVAPTEGGFGEFLARGGIGWTVRARSLDRLGTDSTPLAALEGIRRQVAEMITRALPEPQAGLATAMMIGLRDLVARDVAADFRAAGLSHVVAISGWHICLIAAVVTAALGGLARRPRSLLVLLTICAYSILAGASPSILRAAVMASVVLLARESGRAGQAPAALALTCFGLLLVEPATIEDIGFQLSVAATAGLLIWSKRLGDWLAVRLPRATPAWLREALAVSLAAQAATLPLILYHFATLSLVAPLANLLVAPLVAPAMLLTVLAFGAGALIGIGAPAILFAPVTLIATVGVGAMIGIGHVMASLPFATVQIPEPLNVVFAGGAALVIAYVARRRPSAPASTVAARLGEGRRDPPPRLRLTPRRLTFGGGTVSLCLLLVLVNGARPDGRLHVTVLDIGQGDSILLQGPNGGRMLIDTGPDPDRLLVVLDERLPAWDRRIDVVVLTHPHEDHVAGLALLLDRYRIGAVVEPGMVGPGPGDAAYRRRMTELGRDSRVVAAGDRLSLDGIRLDVVWPIRGRVPLRATNSGTQINNVSIVLDLKFGERRMLFSGDVEEEIDPQLLAAGIATDDNGPLDVLKVAHHGSGTATTDALVERLDPRIAVISAGWGNPYGHPSPATVARLADSGARLYRTDIDGSIDISTNGTDLVASAGGGRPKPTQPPDRRPLGVGFCPIPAQVRARRRPTYNRGDVHPIASRGGGHPARPAADREAARALCHGGRDCRVHLRCHGPPGRDDRRATRRDCCAAA